MAKNCTSPISPQSLEWCEGQTNLPGLRTRLYYIPKSDIVKWPTLPNTLADGDSMGELSTYKGSFTLAANKTWKYIDIIVDKSPATAEVQGSKPSKTFLNKATLTIAKTDEEAAGFARIANNSDYVYIAQQKDGKFRVIGNDMYQTNTDVALNLGGEATEDMGTTIDITCTDICHLPFYKGEIVTEDGIINEQVTA
jgi:hypothetical protein